MVGAPGQATVYAPYRYEFASLNRAFVREYPWGAARGAPPWPEMAIWAGFGFDFDGMKGTNCMAIWPKPWTNFFFLQFSCGSYKTDKRLLHAILLVLSG